MKHQDSMFPASGSRRRAARNRSVSFPTPDQIRLSIQQLVADEDVDQAESLAREGLVAYPENEGVLAISGLVAIVRNDWSQAVSLLERLIAIQGERASEFTQMMYQRARNCLADADGNGLQAARQDLAAAPARDL